MSVEHQIAQRIESLQKGGGSPMIEENRTRWWNKPGV
jgi:hypothetical protein